MHWTQLLDDLDAQRDVDLRKDTREDPVLLAVDRLSEDRLGAPLTLDREAEARGEALARFADETPPGYKDADKDHPNAVGDYLIWVELLAEARRRQLPVTFVTDDAKEDWVWRDKDVRLGAHRSLVQEMHAETGCAFVLLSGTEYLRTARTSLKTAVSDDTLAQTVHSLERRWLSMFSDLHLPAAVRLAPPADLFCLHGDQPGIWKIKGHNQTPNDIDPAQLVARHKDLAAREAELIDNLSILIELQADGETDLDVEDRQLRTALAHTQTEKRAVAAALQSILSTPVDGEGAPTRSWRSNAWREHLLRLAPSPEEDGLLPPQPDGQ